MIEEHCVHDGWVVLGDAGVPAGAGQLVADDVVDVEKSSVGSWSVHSHFGDEMEGFVGAHEVDDSSCTDIGIGQAPWIGVEISHDEVDFAVGPWFSVPQIDKNLFKLSAAALCIFVGES